MRHRESPARSGAISESVRAEHKDDSEQLDIFATADEGRRLRDDGMRVAEHNSHPGACEAIDRVIAELAEEKIEWTTDTVHERVEPLASSSNLMDARINAAARRGEIVCVGVTNSTRPERHSGLLRVWRGAEVRP